MREIRVANRYAKALFEFAIEMNQVERIKQDAVLVSTVCRENRDFVLMLQSPVIRDNTKIKVIKEIFDKHVHEITLKFMTIITRNRREELIADIAEEFASIYREFKNIIPATITTATKLDEETREKILSILRKRSNAEIELKEEINDDLIGGFVLTFSDKQYDASIKRMIQNLHKEFDVNLYVKGF